MSDNPGLATLDDAGAFLRRLQAAEGAAHAYTYDWLAKLFYATGRPRSFWEPASDVVVALRGAERDYRLMAHEWGHSIGLNHPPALTHAWLHDVMGVVVRDEDAFKLVERSEPWRTAHGLP